jgi:hypothetical protein
MSFSESMFSAGFNQKTRKVDQKCQKKLNLITMKTILEYSRGLQEATPRGRAREGARWDRPAPPSCRPTPSARPHLSASRMFLHRLPRPHLRCSLRQFDPRARVAPLGL